MTKITEQRVAALEESLDRVEGNLDLIHERVRMVVTGLAHQPAPNSAAQGEDPTRQVWASRERGPD